jgi:hypothetical protein
VILGAEIALISTVMYCYRRRESNRHVSMPYLRAIRTAIPLLSTVISIPLCFRVSLSFEINVAAPTAVSIVNLFVGLSVSCSSASSFS